MQVTWLSRPAGVAASAVRPATVHTLLPSTPRAPGRSSASASEAAARAQACRAGRHHGDRGSRGRRPRVRPRDVAHACDARQHDARPGSWRERLMEPKSSSQEAFGRPWPRRLRRAAWLAARVTGPGDEPAGALSSDSEHGGQARKTRLRLTNERRHCLWVAC